MQLIFYITTSYGRENLQFAEISPWVWGDLSRQISVVVKLGPLL